jgi:K+-sensing histidine kinase KdpD
MTPPPATLPRIDETLGQITRLVGHDLRNNLCVMQNSVYFLNMKLGRENDKVSKHLDMLAREIALSNRTIVNLMDLLAPKNPTRSPLDINELVRRSIAQNPMPESLRARLTLGQGLPTSEADSEQVGRAVENVLLYQYATLKADDALHISTFVSGAGVNVEFLDSGAGLSAGELEHLFDVQPGDRSAASHLGLVVARRLMDLNGGRLEASTRPGIGTRIGLSLPCA